MHIRGRRGIGALVLLLVFLVGAAAFLPLIALGQSYQITGLVRVCAQPTFVASATVMLTDVNGINPPRTAASGLDGVYRFAQPPTGTYSVSANRSGYFDSDPSNPVRFDGNQTVNIDVCMYPHGSPPKVLAVTVTGTGGSPVPGATVSAYSPSNPTGRIQLVTTGTTDSSGVANLTLWPAVFSVRASATGLQTVESSVDVSAVSSTTISLVAAVELYGHVKDLDSGAFLGTGVAAWLYNPAAANTSAFRLIPATVKDSLFEFEDVRVTNGDYRIIVDAKGYLAHTNTLTLSGSPTEYNVDLTAALLERYDTTVLYGTQDWNNLTVWRNLTLNADSTLPGLVPANLRNLRLQIDATLGNGDGSLQASEITAFTNWLDAKGPAYVTTDDFLTTNSKAYLSSVASFVVTVDGLSAGAITNGPLWVNATATYALEQAPPYIRAGAKTYYLNMTLVPDANVTTYQNFTYTFALPRTYERNVTTLVPANSATLTNFTRFTVDPGLVSGNQRVDVRMTVSQALNGTARAKVIAPVGKFHEQNTSFTNFQAFVANNTTLTFSARDSSDPNGHVEDANFTWQFTPDLNDTRYGIEPEFKYTQNGTYTVNLTMVEAGGNVSYRNITVYVDDSLPLAKIRTNRTGPLPANGRLLQVDQGIPVRFDGALSKDLAYPGKDGVIRIDTGYSWDFDGNGVVDATGRNVTWTFPKPGLFTVNLTVTDSVGWKSANGTMQAQVNDTKAPVPAFDILDPDKDWGTIMSPMERKTIALNASKTTDDYDKVATMNFTWTIPGPIVGVSGTRPMYGMNVSFAWGEWNISYKVTLSVRDSGFGSNKPNTGNLSRNITVQIDTSIHADLQIVADPTTRAQMKVQPTDPEEGASVTITVNVTNKANRATALNVTTELAVISGGVTTALPDQPEWSRNGVPTTDHTIPSGTTVTLVFTTHLSGQGNKTLRVNVFDSSEPYTWRTPENRASSAVNVRQPGWQPYAIVGSVIGVIALFVFGMYARRKIKAGEWRPIRGRRGEKGGEEKPRKEAKEEKKRL